MARSALLTLVAAGLCGCDGELVNLGASEPLVAGGSAGSVGQGAGGSAMAGGSAGALTGAWQPPVLIIAQEENVLLSNPTLTRDEQFLYYTEQLDASQLSLDYSPVGVFRRTAQGEAWASRSEVDLGLEQVDVSSPAISPDGDELWFGQNVAEGAGGTDIWVSLLDGRMPEHVETPLNSAADDAPRPIGGNGLLMPLQSRRHGGERYRIYLASRAAADVVEWEIGESDRERLRTINSDAFVSVDGFLTEDGLTLYFASNRNTAGGYDLYVAERDSVEHAFAEPSPLTGINTQADERSPWVSPSQERIYFASNRSTADYQQWALYRSSRTP